jgi:uncharacterized membrane protein
LPVVTLAVKFADVALAIHIMAVVVAFGVLFSYPLIFTVGRRLDPRAMPWMHRVQVEIWRRLVSPGLLVVLVFGIYLASHEHQWSKFYVQWGLAAVVIIGAAAGAFFTPKERRLAELAQRDLDAAGSGELAFSAEYESLARQVAIGGAVADLLILATILFMTLHTGA